MEPGIRSVVLLQIGLLVGAVCSDGCGLKGDKGWRSVMMRAVFMALFAFLVFCPGSLVVPVIGLLLVDVNCLGLRRLGPATVSHKTRAFIKFALGVSAIVLIANIALTIYGHNFRQTLPVNEGESGRQGRIVSCGCALAEERARVACDSQYGQGTFARSKVMCSEKEDAFSYHVSIGGGTNMIFDVLKNGNRVFAHPAP